MPLIKRPADRAAEAEQPAGDPLALLRHADPDTRWQAARSLGDRQDAAEALGHALVSEPEPRVRDAIATSLVRIGTADAVAALLPHLRSESSALRTLAVDALGEMPSAVAPQMPALLSDADPDIRILAVELARGMTSARIPALLTEALKAEQHPNVAASLVDVLSEIGTADAADTLRSARGRFASDPFLPFAIDIALERLTGQKG